MKASIIIPAYNAEKTIGNCLKALQNQSFPRKEFEVIVVDDGSTDETAAIASSFRGTIVLRQKNAGPAVARNAGAKKASGEILVFTDSDCLPEKNWLEEMLRPFKDSQIVGVQGAYKTRQKNWVARFVQFEIEERYERMKKREFIDFIGSYSAAYRRDAFLKVHGFDEKFRIASGEDPDLSFRIAKAGGKMVFNPKAVLFHSHPESIGKYWKTKFYRAYWRVRLYEKNPQKMKKDSYTPGGFKFQMMLLAIVLVFGLLDFLASWASHTVFKPSEYIQIALLMVPFCTWPQSLFILKKDAILGIASIFIFWINAFLFLSGFLYGTIRGVQK